MFPGYVTLYKDKNGLTHLYFFRGITDDGNQFYRAIDTSDWKVKYKINIHNEYTTDYIFEIPIIKVICKLIDVHDKSHTVELKIKSGN